MTTEHLLNTALSLLRRPTVRNIAQDKPADQLDELKSKYAGTRILLVEDNEINQLVASELLKLGGLVADVAPNGAVALEMLRGNAYALVLMDIHMPVMDGLMATRAIRQSPEWRSLPILAMSAAVDEKDRQICLEAGMNDFVLKPVEPDLLASTLLRWLPASVESSLKSFEDVPDAIAPTPIQTLATLQIDGLDTHEGLGRCGGKPDFYLSMLRQFVARWDHCDLQLHALAHQQEWAEVHRMVHTLKSVAGSLGVRRVFLSAQTLERQCKAITDQSDSASTDDALHEMSGLLQELKRVIDALKRALPVDGVQPPSATRAPLPESKNFSTRLAAMLDNCDLEVLDLVLNQQDQLRQLFKEKYEAFERASRNCDFDEAKLILESVYDSKNKPTSPMAS